MSKKDCKEMAYILLELVVTHSCSSAFIEILENQSTAYSLAWKSVCKHLDKQEIEEWLSQQCEKIKIKYCFKNIVDSYVDEYTWRVKTLLKKQYSQVDANQ